jgi:hypothetical protein
VCSTSGIWLFFLHKIDVVIICDGEKRHHSNGQTTKRQADRYKKQFANFTKKTELMTVTQKAYPL